MHRYFDEAIFPSNICVHLISVYIHVPPRQILPTLDLTSVHYRFPSVLLLSGRSQHLVHPLSRCLYVDLSLL